MKKYFIIFLISSLLISMFSSASGLSVSAATRLNNVIEKKEGHYKETFEINGVKYFYEDNEEYTISITMSLNGDRIIAYKDKSVGDNEIYYLNETSNTLKTRYKNEPVDTSSIEMNSLQTSEIKDLENIKEKVLNNEIKLEKKSIQDFGEVTHFAESKDVDLLKPNSISDDARKVYKALAREEGPQYTYKWLMTRYSNGIEARLYGHKTFGAHKKASKIFKAGTAIGIIASFLSFPISKIVGIASWVSAGLATLELAKGSEFQEWSATAYRQKVVKIESVYPYRAFYDKHYSAAVGPKGAVLSKVLRTYKSSDYDSNDTLLSKGIEYYIRYH